MNRILSNLLLLIICGVLFASCITQKQFDELVQVRDYYKSEAEAVDSISIANQDLVDTNRELELQLKQTTRELEELAVANQSLARNNEEILGKYNQLINQQKNELTTYSYEKLGLQEQLAAQQEALEKQKEQLKVMEYELYERESKLNTIEYDFNTSLSQRDEQIKQLKQMLNAKESSMEQLRGSISQTLRGFSDTDLTVTEKNGKIYLSLSQELLFSSGSAKVNQAGQAALKQVASIIKGNDEIDIIVEGHTDSDGTSAKNWDLSVDRATSVVKLLTQNGISPKQITASGRGEYAPIATNSTRRGKALNRRTEIILSPKLDELYNLLNQSSSNSRK